jgi:3-hydroxyisobutyrate dehydrogenase-like beta-hydroxyacid dehydrogenase
VVPGVLKARADRLAALGAAVVDAPVSGGPELVAAGQCGIFLGGDDDAAARALNALKALTDRIFHVGPLGTGLVMKTINNAMIQVYIAGLAEQLRLAGRAGLPLKTALTILGSGPAGMPAMRDRIPKMLGEDDTVGFPVSGLLKDHAVFRRVAGDSGVETPALAAAEPLFLDAIEAGLAEVDGAAILARAYRDDV